MFWKPSIVKWRPFENSFKFAWKDTFNFACFKDALMQIWKSRYTFVFIQKQYPANLAFLILRILVLFMREVYKFLKKWANF